MNLIFGMLNKTCQFAIKEEKPCFKIDLNIENINIKLSESLYYTMHFIIDVMKPTKNMDHWSIVEQSKLEIKNNCKVLGKIMKKKNFNKTNEYFGVLSGGYIYFYKNLEDDQFESYFYIKDAIIIEKINHISLQDKNNDTKYENLNKDNTHRETLEEYSLALKNKYGNIEIIIPNENKYKQWIKGIKERINEMRSYEEVNIKKLDITKFVINDDTNNHIDIEKKELNIQYKISNFSAAPTSKSDTKKNQDKQNIIQKDPEINNLNQDSNKGISQLKINLFSVRINIKNVNIELTDENAENKDMVIFKCKFIGFNFEFLFRELDFSLRIDLDSIQIYDEKFVNDNSLYEMLTTINKLGTKTKIFSLSLIVADDGSPIRFKNAGMDLDLKIGCIYAIWYPLSIKRLLFFFAHNEILRNKIKDEIMTPIFEEKNMINNELNISNKNFEKDIDFINKNINRSIIYKEEKFNEDKPPEESDDEFIILNCSESKDLYLYLKLSLQEVKIIWVQPNLNHYFIEVTLGLTILYFEMTNDHMKIYGELGNTRLVDLTNYPYTIKTQKEFLELKNKNHKFTEILGFQDFSSLTFEYSSYNLLCPLQKENYTSKAYVNFNSVRLNFVQEQFFRVFNYLFSDFLGSLAVPQNIKEYKISLSKIPKLKEEDIEFMDLIVTFNNPQLLLKPRYKFEESFLADLGTVTIKNTYKKVKNKSKILPEKEKWITTYSFDLKDFFIIANDKFKLIEKTNAFIDMDFINLTNEEKLSNDPNFIDKCIDFEIKLDEINLNLRQKDFTNLMKCSDLNFVYIDGLSDYYNINQDENQKQNELEKRKSVNEKENQIILGDDSLVYICNKYNFMYVNIEIPNISLFLYENDNRIQKNEIDKLQNKIFASLLIKNKNLNFSQKITGRKDISIKASMLEIYHHLSDNTKELMLTQYHPNEFKIKDSDLINPVKNIKDLLELTFVIEEDKDKNIVLKINNLKTILRLDTLQLMRFFFTEGFPFYDEMDQDLPNQCTLIFSFLLIYKK